MKRLITAVIILVAFSFIVLFWWQNGSLPANQKDKTPKIFIVKNGEGVKEISNNLKKEGLIKDPIVFFLLARQKGLDKQIQAGDFRLNPSMSALDVATTLTHGTLDIWITIPEGVRADEIADILKNKIPSYKETWREALDKNEGYLFPDTYLIPKDADINLVISLLKNTFESKYSTLNALQSSLSKEEIVTIASLIEREARYDKDRPLVASVILNRFNIGMKLDIDATVQYALGYQEDEKRWWKKNLTEGDLKLRSPYNTYLVAGLPPTPISNPGLQSIRAAMNPVKTNYFFYMTDKNGVTHYAETIEVQNANIKKYGTP